MCTLAAALAGLAAPPAAAQAWTAQAGARAALDHNSNPALAADAGAALRTARLTASANAERGSPLGATRGEGELVLDASHQAGRGNGSALGRLTLSHRVDAERDVWSGRLGYRRDRPLDSGRTASEIAFGRGEQTVGDLSLGWSRTLSERLSLDLDASASRTQLSGGVAGQGFRLASGNAGLKYRWHETATLSATLGRTRQQLASGVQRTDIDSLRLRWSQTLTERTSMQASVARSDTLQAYTLRGLVCPLPVGFCQAGLVPYVPAEQQVRLQRQQVQYDASGSWRWLETTTLSASASRALTPGTQGVSQDDRLGFGLAHELGPSTSASLALDASRTRPAGAQAQAGGRLRSFTLAATHRLDERLSLQFQAQQRRYRPDTPSPGASGTVISISLQYLGATVPVWP